MSGCGSMRVRRTMSATPSSSAAGDVLDFLGRRFGLGA
jgi:hypothetical protein